MKNIDSIRERYLKEPFNRRLGHLASDLARISSFLDNLETKEVVFDILEESKFFIEWLAPEAPPYIQIILPEMQLKLALWQRHLMREKENSYDVEKLKSAAKAWSSQLLDLSGLIAV